MTLGPYIDKHLLSVHNLNIPLTYEELGELRTAIENYMDETPLPEPGK